MLESRILAFPLLTKEASPVGLARKLRLRATAEGARGGRAVVLFVFRLNALKCLCYGRA